MERLERTQPKPKDVGLIILVAASIFTLLLWLSILGLAIGAVLVDSSPAEGNMAGVAGILLVPALVFTIVTGIGWDDRD